VAVLKSANKASEQSKQKLSITIFFKFPIQLWLISLFCTSIFSANTTLINLGKKFLVDKYEESILVASAQSSAYFFGMVISAPIFGLLVNLTGYNLIWIVAGGVFAILNHSLLAFTYFSPSVVLLSMGMSAILVSVASSSILPETVKADQLAAAFGILQGVLNLGDSIFSIIGGNIIQEHGYFALELLNYYLSICTYKKFFHSLIFQIHTSNYDYFLIFSQ
jgi:MFS family permease